MIMTKMNKDFERSSKNMTSIYDGHPNPTFTRNKRPIPIIAILFEVVSNQILKSVVVI